GAHLYAPSTAGITTVCATSPDDPDVRMPTIAPTATTPATPRLSHSRRRRISSIAAFRRIPPSATAQSCHIARLYAAPAARRIPAPQTALRSSGGERRACRGGRAGQDLVLARSVPSERADVLRLRSLLSPCRVELDLLVLVQRPIAACHDRGEVNEHVRRPVIGGDETKALVGVEPLHRACCHVPEILIRHAIARPRRSDRDHTRSRLRSRVRCASDEPGGRFLPSGRRKRRAATRWPGSVTVCSEPLPQRHRSG